MKITDRDYTSLENDINNVLKIRNLTIQQLKQLYHQDCFTEQRVRWDLFHAVNIAPDFPYRRLYEYLNDNHIDTALKKITNTR